MSENMEESMGTQFSFQAVFLMSLSEVIRIQRCLSVLRIFFITSSAFSPAPEYIIFTPPLISEVFSPGPSL